MLNRQSKFAYSRDQLIAIENALSSARLTKYIGWSGGELYRAVRLYERNTAVSEGMYGVIQGLEVALRNSFHDCLCSFAASEDWYDHLHFEPWEFDSIQRAKASAAKDSGLAKPGKVVAELTFGFWVGLTTAIYEKRLWVPCLHKAFPFKRVNRKQLYTHLDDLRRLRNRIAHHEPILDRPLERSYSEVLEVLRWISPAVSEWIDATNCFVERWGKPLSG